MVKKSKPQNNKRNANKRAVPKILRAVSLGPLSDPRVRAWDALLRDPCAANLAPPCYAGTDSGYLARTVDHFQPVAAGVGLTVNNDIPCDYIFQWTPFNLSTSSGIVAGGTTGTNAYSVAAGGFTNFISAAANAAVRRYRPIACCVKWVPTGAYAKRAGTVGCGYSTGQVLNVSTPTTAQMLSECNRIAPNGSEHHEVRWLPTAVDENFTAVEVANNTAAGCVFYVLRGIDGTVTSTTTAALAGYFEVTTVWEWVPERTTGLNTAPKAPLPYTTQQVLATIGDMGAYLFQGVRAAGPGVMRAAGQMGMAYLTKGVQSAYTRPGQHMLAM